MWLSDQAPRGHWLKKLGFPAGLPATWALRGEVTVQSTVSGSTMLSSGHGPSASRGPLERTHLVALITQELTNTRPRGRKGRTL